MQLSTGLEIAIKKGDLEKVKSLIKKGDDEIDAVFAAAAEEGKLEIVKYLFEQGVDIHKWNEYALKWSAYNGHLEVAKFLVEHGADKSNCRVLSDVIIQGHLDIAKYLIEANGYISPWLVEHASRLGRLELVKYLVGKGANVQATDAGAPLTAAARFGHIEVVKCLVEAGADIHYNYEEALRLAAYKNEVEIVKYLLEKGADPRQVDYEDLVANRKYKKVLGILWDNMPVEELEVFTKSFYTKLRNAAKKYLKSRKDGQTFEHTTDTKV